jgi:hypothetical protein
MYQRFVASVKISYVTTGLLLLNCVIEAVTMVARSAHWKMFALMFFGYKGTLSSLQQSSCSDVWKIILVSTFVIWSMFYPPRFSGPLKWRMTIYAIT